MSGGGNNDRKISEKEKSMRAENAKLRAEVQALETTLATVENDFKRSCLMRDRLDSLCKELHKQTKEIKDESAASIQNAEIQGNQLAKEVSDNMGFMETVNENLSAVTNESLKVKKENEELAAQISVLKNHYDERETRISKDLQDANDDLMKTKTELAQLRLKSAQDKERVFGEMQKLADNLVESRSQMKDAKEIELKLRILIQNYDEKFIGLQTSLKETNTAYGSFKGEMEKVGDKTKELERETIQWQKKWEESNTSLIRMTNAHHKLQVDLTRVHDSLVKMTSLYQALDKDRRDILKKLKRPNV